MNCAQALFLVRHHFLPAFVSTYLSLPADRNMLGEDKFVHVERCYPHLSKRLSFGVDRMRPMPLGDEVWYAQQFSPQEIATLKQKNLI
jgi:hypothetical protein